MGKTDAESTTMTRIEARVPRRLKEIVNRAATIRGQTQTDFVIAALSEVAGRVITSDDVPYDDSIEIKFSPANQLAIATALLDEEANPTVDRGLPGLREVMNEYRKKVISK